MTARSLVKNRYLLKGISFREILKHFAVEVFKQTGMPTIKNHTIWFQLMFKKFCVNIYVKNV